jgi:hypothetical protein
MKIKSNSNDVKLEVIDFKVLNEILFSHVIFKKIWKKICEKYITHYFRNAFKAVYVMLFH